MIKALLMAFAFGALARFFEYAIEVGLNLLHRLQGWR